MRTYFKYTLLLLVSIFISSNLTFAKNVCKQEPVQLDYSSTGVSRCEDILDNQGNVISSVTLNSADTVSFNAPNNYTIYSLQCYRARVATDPAVPLEVALPLATDALTINSASACGCVSGSVCTGYGVNYCATPRVWGNDETREGVCCPAGQTWSATGNYDAFTGATTGSCINVPVVITGTLNTPDCTIPPGGRGCNINITGTVSGGVTPHLLVDFVNIWGTEGAVINRQFLSETVNSHSIRLVDVNGLIASSLATSKCSAGESWDPNAANNTGACSPSTSLQPSGNLGATACVIASGASSCNTMLNWSTSNRVGGANTGVTRPIDITVSSLHNSPVGGQAQAISVPAAATMASTNFFLYHNSVFLDMVNVQPLCANGNSWDGNSCEPSAVSGSISANACVIAANASTCTSKLTWAVLNAGSNPSEVLRGTTLLSTLSSHPGTGLDITLTGITTQSYTLNHMGLPLGNTTVTSYCAANTVWSAGSSTCVPCGNGGCNGGGAGNPPAVCANGTSNAPTCNSCSNPLYSYSAGSNSCILRPVATINSTAPIANSTNININFTCSSSDTWGFMTPVQPVPDANPTSNATSYTSSFVYNMTAQGQSVTLRCSNGSGFDDRTVVLTNPAFERATINKVSVNPPELSCSGGPVTVSWSITDSKDKSCTLDAYKLSGNLNYSDAALNLVKNYLGTGTYKDITNRANPVVRAVSDIFNGQNNSSGLLDGVTLKHSTRFELKCGGLNGIPEVKRSAEAKVVCSGQQ